MSDTEKTTEAAAETADTAQSTEAQAAETKTEEAGEKADESGSSQPPAPADAATQALVAAKQAGASLLVDAKSSVEKLVQIAKGDEQALLTEAEAAAIPIAIQHVPTPLQPIAASFAQAAASKAAGPLNAVVEEGVHAALGAAHNWLELAIESASAFIRRLSGKHY